MDKAEREEKLFPRFKAEESSQAITGERRLLSPEDNNERQAIHDHESVPLNTLNASGSGRPKSRPAGATEVRHPGLTVSAAALLASFSIGVSAAPSAIVFTDVTAAAGIKFVHNSGRAGKKFLPETLGSGVRLLRRRRRRLARHPAGQRQGLDSRAAARR